MEMYWQTPENEKVRFAVGKLRTGLDRQPQNNEWRYYLGLGHHQLGEWQKAVDVLEPVGSLPAMAFGIVGDSTLRLSKGARGMEYFEEQLRRWPWFPDSDGYLANHYLQAGQLNTLLEREQQVFRHHPDDAVRLEAVANAMQRLGKPAREIEPILERAIRADGMRSTPYLFEARLAGQKSDIKSVEAALKKALLVEPASLVVRTAWAQYLLSQGRSEDAAVQLEIVTMQQPNYLPARQLLEQIRRN
jgi:tetratricopeptide (TPR) repeat protein